MAAAKKTKKQKHQKGGRPPKRGSHERTSTNKPRRERAKQNKTAQTKSATDEARPARRGLSWVIVLSCHYSFVFRFNCLNFLVLSEIYDCFLMRLPYAIRWVLKFA